jgi:hypothetical protein
MASAAIDYWILMVNSDNRLKVILGNEEIQDLTIKISVKKSEGNTAEYSKFWTVTPSMIDSLETFIVDIT